MKGFGYLAKEGLKNVWSNRIMSIASVCVLVSCLVLTGAAALFSINVAQVVESVGDSNETTVYIKSDVSQLEAVYIGKDIEKVSNVASATFYSKDEAFKQYKEELGEELFSKIEDRNPLPDAFIVVMDDLSLYDETVANILKIDGVDSINDHRELAKKLTDISNLVNVGIFHFFLQWIFSFHFATKIIVIHQKFVNILPCRRILFVDKSWNDKTMKLCFNLITHIRKTPYKWVIFQCR